MKFFHGNGLELPVGIYNCGATQTVPFSSVVDPNTLNLDPDPDPDPDPG